MPLSFWPFAFHSAVYLYNINVSVALSNKSPFEMYYGKKPQIDNIKVWGCRAWLSLPREGSYRVNKLQPRAVMGRFIGYAKDRKGWVFWIPEWKQTKVWWEVHSWIEDSFDNLGVDTSEKDYTRWLDWDEQEEREKVLSKGGNVEIRQEIRQELPPDDPPPLPLPEIASPNRFDPLAQPPPLELPRQESPPPREISPPPPPPPQPLAPPEPRRSGRLAGEAPPHFVPIEGAPAALRVEIPPPHPTTRFSSLTFATHDNSLDLTNSSIAAIVDLDDNASRPEVLSALHLALSTNSNYDGNLDAPAYWELKGRPDLDLWLTAMADEIAAFDATGTWDGEVVELPKGRKAISVKWVLLIKRDTEGKVIKYKARLVARGDMQVDGIDYDETYSSTVRLTAVRLAFALLAQHRHWKLCQFDISNAYLLGNLDREIYIRQPPGFINSKNPSGVRRLRKALYGLKQGGREWQKVLRGALEEIGFKPCPADNGFYVRWKNGKVTLIPTHVDDGMIMGDDDMEATVNEISTRLEGKLKLVDNSLFLGMRIRRHEDGSVELDQTHYIKSILDRFFPNGLSPISTPLDSSYSSITAATEDERFECPYRELLGALMYLSSCTRPDLAFPLSFAARFASCPAQRHWSTLKHICRYLSGTSSLGLRYSPSHSPFSPDMLTGWSDADHGADKDTRRSVSGYVFGFGDDSMRSTAISWLSRRQKSVAISSSESEYMAMSEASREAVWLRQLLVDLGFPPSSPTLIRGDNSGSLLLASHPTSHSRTKHIAIHYHFTRELVENQTVVLKWVPTNDMVADVFTKGLDKKKHEMFTMRCGLRDLSRKGGCEIGETKGANKD
ncbi:hypothetical protein JCM5353_003799, partial [Sporobolomyces roseus]